MRKIVQISTPTELSVVALCDDGSVWRNDDISILHCKMWKRTPPIPQDEEPTS